MPPTASQNPKKKSKIIRGFYWVATVAVLIVYVAIARGTIESCETVFSSTTFDAGARRVYYLGLLTPPLFALCAALMMTYIGRAKSAGNGAWMLWALLLLGAVIGWPVSCATGVLLTPGSSMVR
jgi:uncharacterized membrane protein YhaH (DUF805 family)